MENKIKKFIYQYKWYKNKLNFLQYCILRYKEYKIDKQTKENFEIFKKYKFENKSFDKGIFRDENIKIEIKNYSLGFNPFADTKTKLKITLNELKDMYQDKYSEQEINWLYQNYYL